MKPSVIARLLLLPALFWACGSPAAPVQCISPETRSLNIQRAEDGAPADIQSFAFNALAGDAENSPSLEFDITLSRSFSNAGSLQLLYWAVGHDQTWINVPRAGSSPNRFYLLTSLNRYARGGQYAVRSLRMFDDYGSDLQLNESQLNELGYETTVFVENVEEDITPPILQNLELKPLRYSDATPKLQFEVSATDDKSGLQSAAILEFTSPTGTSLQQWFYFSEDGIATDVFSFPKYSANGTYRINTIRLHDNAGNSNFSYDYISANPGSSEVIIAHADSDTSPPDLESFKLNAVFDPCANRPFIDINGTAKDDRSGLKGVLLRLGRPNGGLLDKWLYYTHGSGETSLEFNKNIALTTEFTPGIYSVTYLTLNDVASNQVSLGANDLQPPKDNALVFSLETTHRRRNGFKHPEEGQSDYWY